MQTLDVLSNQEKDPYIGSILRMMKAGTRKPLEDYANPPLRSLWSRWSRLTVENGILHRRWETEDGQMSHLQIVVPKVLIKDVLNALHSQNTAAHLGLEKTLVKVRARFNWYGYRGILSYFANSVKCVRRLRHANIQIERHFSKIPRPFIGKE